MAALKYWVWLTALPGLSNRSRLLLLERYGSPEDVYYADAEELALTEGLTPGQAQLLSDKSLTRADRILADCARGDIFLLTMQDAAYPARLRDIFDPPVLLYGKGSLPLFDEEAAIAVVGTRSCTPYGLRCAHRMGYELARQGAAYAVVTLKDATGVVYYASQVPAAAASPARVTVDPARVAAIFREEGLIPVAKLAAFRDPAGARADHAMAIGYTGQAYLWLDNKASADGKPWLNPYADAAVQYIGDLIDELHTAGFEQVVLENVHHQRREPCRPAAGRYGGLGAALRQRCDPVVQLYAGRGGRHLQHTGRPGRTAGREEPCGAGAFGLHHDRRGARCSGAGADRSGRRACGRAGQCGRIL